MQEQEKDLIIKQENLNKDLNFFNKKNENENEIFESDNKSTLRSSLEKKFWYIVAALFVSIIIILLYINGMSVYDRNL